MAAGEASEVFKLAATFTRSAGQIGAAAALVVRATAFRVEADAKALSPVDTGNLRNSISASIEGDGRFSSVSAEIGPTAEYAPFVEYGTSRMGPQPFMAPAFERNVGAFEQAITIAGGELL